MAVERTERLSASLNVPARVLRAELKRDSKLAQPNGSPVNFGRLTLRGAIRLVDGRSEERSQVVEAAAGGAAVAIMARAWAMSSLIVVESSESSAEWGRGEILEPKVA